MEVDFVNEYISRLVARVHDLTSQNIMLETRLALNERALAEVNIELQQLKTKTKKAETSSV